MLGRWRVLAAAVVPILFLAARQAPAPPPEDPLDRFGLSETQGAAPG